MLRCVAAFLFVATAQGLSLQKADPVDLRPAGVNKTHQYFLDLRMASDEFAADGITYPAVCDLMVFSDELLKPKEVRKGEVKNDKDDDAEDVAEADDIETTKQATKKGGKGQDENDDDFAKKAKNMELGTKEIKKGDGKTFVVKGDKVKLLMKGTLKQAHFQDVQFEGIYEYEYPLPKFPGVAGQANPLAIVKDTKILPDMTLGGVSSVSLEDKKTKEINTVEVTLLDVRKASVGAKLEKVEPSAELSREATFVKILEKQKVSSLTMHRKVLKLGDEKTKVNKGDVITMRQTGTMKEKGKTIVMNNTLTYPYPMLIEPFTMKVKGASFRVKFSWDEKVVPDMTEGEHQEITFDPMRFKFGLYVSPKYTFPPFNMELLKVHDKK